MEIDFSKVVGTMGLIRHRNSVSSVIESL